MDCSIPGFLHYLPGFAQIHVHWVGDTIQTSHPLPPSSPFAFNLSQCQGLFQWVGSSYQKQRCTEAILTYYIHIFFLVQNLTHSIYPVNASFHLDLCDGLCPGLPSSSIAPLKSIFHKTLRMSFWFILYSFSCQPRAVYKFFVSIMANITSICPYHFSYILFSSISVSSCLLPENYCAQFWRYTM